MLDFYQNANVNDLHCVAYSYAPLDFAGIQSKHTTSTDQSATAWSPHNMFLFSDKTKVSSLYVEVPNIPLPNEEQVFSANSPDSPDSPVIKNNTHTLQRMRSELDPDKNMFGTVGEEKAIMHRIARDQVLLAFTTMAYEPKEDVCDFVEDLTLAGIRFVYCSPLGERETKGKLKILSSLLTCEVKSAKKHQTQFSKTL